MIAPVDPYVAQVEAAQAAARKRDESRVAFERAMVEWPIEWRGVSPPIEFYRATPRT